MNNDDTNTTNTTPTTVPGTGAPAAVAQESDPRSPRRRTGLLVAGVATAVVLAAGVGAGFAVALSDDDDRTSFTSSSGDGGSSVSAETDLDGMLDAASTALSAADGEVVGIEERTDGTWRVDVQSDGREVEVEVDGSQARILEEDADGDDDGDRADLPLTDDTVRSLVDAATAEAAGRVVQLSSDDDGYSVEVLTGAGSVVELDLDASFQVVSSDRDDD